MMAKIEEEVAQPHEPGRGNNRDQMLTLQPLKPTDQIFKSIRKRDGRIVAFDRGRSWRRSSKPPRR